jgi:hypothetical protein
VWTEKLRSKSRLPPEYGQKNCWEFFAFNSDTDKNEEYTCMKKFMFAFSMVLFLTSLGLAGATNQQPESSAASTAQKAAKTVSGEVVSVDPAKNELVVKDETGGEVRLQVGKSTKVIKEGKAISLADLKPSEKVVCEAEELGGAWAAKMIRVS